MDFWTRGTNGQGFFHVKHIIEKFIKNYQIRVLRLTFCRFLKCLLKVFKRFFEGFSRVFCGFYESL
jgi:hypothetical protein